MHKKLFLAHKNCLTCKKDFLWRKKWQANWAHVLYCSERCRRNKNTINSALDSAQSRVKKRAKLKLNVNLN
ncbi:DUF2256 domain-containing protein [Colwellia sp. MB02u-18]|uniref:DUF2256 domain-containing protein n=1 Tax=unclassified Colwellia TaxID=196834 RepID=UPI0015F470FE|nr:DUF2256 domain-containing protein [Colwellia sp. MB3u-45]MBA6268109.1 DUF2256 domain-containing protein [Colwellia sp. MB3u-43]MBA6322561.1 DUF2256 domain-containing protein [Colwellia sp. MB02u-19]MBA6326139.1 DUF2256 domain-containing protein [Colwellia sp. MB02u-18]MBA6331598.1 DUF2256 domain-containing protein [Colwellia sp. MB02u-12]MBA6344271.1 DUF2256 domain-containing protein [Colwellia sp. MB02u-1]